MNQFDVKALEHERVFVKRIKRGTTFHTGTGAENMIVSVEGNVIYLRTTRSKRPFRLTRKQLRRAIALLLSKRMATRKDLERCNKFSSALMGVLQLVFASIARFKRTLRGLLLIRLHDVRHVFSGLARAPRDIKLVRAFGGTEILISFFHARENPQSRWKTLAKRMGLLVMLDSGEYSRYVAEQAGQTARPIRVEDYADFIQQHKDVASRWMNLDRIGGPEESEFNLRYLTNKGLPPIPVWHVQSPWEALETLIREDHALIAVGGSAFLSNEQRRVIFRELFNRYPNDQAFHLLGGTSPVIADYPWFSADSTSWLNARKCGRLVTPRLQMKMPEDWSSDEGLAFNIAELSAMEGNYERLYSMPLPLRPDVGEWEHKIGEGMQCRLFG